LQASLITQEKRVKRLSLTYSRFKEKERENGTRNRRALITVACYSMEPSWQTCLVSWHKVLELHHQRLLQQATCSEKGCTSQTYLKRVLITVVVDLSQN